jgi:3-dehydroquinate dehydratase type I
VIKYCLPIIESTKVNVLRAITTHSTSGEYDYFEVWLDYIDDVDIAFLEELLNKLGNKLIFLFRTKDQGSLMLSDSTRKAFIDRIAYSEAYLDIDIHFQKNDLEYSATLKKPVKTILSYHNYKETPDDLFLDQIITAMEQYNPSLYKIACFCQHEKDALRLLALGLHLKKNKKKYIVLGMGEHGVITRIFGTAWGNEMIFAPQSSSNESAPHQLTLLQLITIFNQLHYQ